MTKTPVLQIKGLSIGQQAQARTELVRDVSLTVRAGETVCVVGESGSGKSLTALSIMGLLDPAALRPTAGQILLEGEDVLRVSPARMRALRAARMSMIFQEPMSALNPAARIGAQIDEVLRLHTPLPPRTRKARVMDMLAAAQLPDPPRIYAAYPHQLSGGQLQRVMICMALILRPRLLIADEPTTALDVGTQRQILSLIAALQAQQGTAVLFITHDFGVVADIADRVVVMRAGAVVETGPRDSILRAPSQPYTRDLIAAVPSLRPPVRAPIASATALEVNALSKSFTARRLLRSVSRTEAVANISLHVRSGEVLGIVGPSGSGKSTLARCIMGLERPDQGQVRIAGRDISPLRDARRDLQMVFQDPYRSLNPRLNIRDALTEGPTNFGTPLATARAAAEAMITRVGLSPAALQRYPHQFSGGQRQRIAIARALMLRPKVLVADEAVSALDVSVQAQILHLLDQIRRETVLSIVFITHDLRVAAQICDRIMVMQDGRVVEDGPAHTVLTAPKAPLTRELLDAAPGRAWDFVAGAPMPKG
ncbi:peptide/nickel transport system ATP-binding protein [Ketogulonicigenium robustum]|uniref:Peptide/nickel transport system ATP-binding protein n=1 Tax=Ketogulonicigenium robustum TaxID=92947 RepID=A0A1W6NX30_9RHOB|nr:ABC transporter ATP-binding protein [Ketogulonicigenium robustum]ARO13806.1 peptide/nickel transport system ATP-binding protein [Ketogulonicigenium robustum]